MGKEKIKQGIKKTAKSHITHTLLTGLAFGLASYYRTPNDYAGMELNSFNSTAPFNEQPIFGAHNAGTSVGEGTPFYAASQQLEIKQLIEKTPMRAFEFDVHLEGEVNATPPPTMAPSAMPSEVPSQSPAPSGVPTAKPSESVEPSASPSKMPTPSPTISSEPTAEPSSVPSAAPTSTPEPTGIPSKPPSAAPTISSAPSLRPSSEPTISKQPSESPTQTPSDRPTISNQPTVSEEPSPAPSIEPTVTPTISPAPTITAPPTNSFAPSASPTVSSAPSASPSISFEPTASPSTPAPTLPFATDENYIVRHGSFDFLATSEPRKLVDVLKDVKDSIIKVNNDKNDGYKRAFAVRFEEFGRTDPELKHIQRIFEDTFDDMIWSKEEQLKYAKTHNNTWPSEKELLEMNKPVILMNQHKGIAPYQKDFVPEYGDNEDRTFSGNILRGTQDVISKLPLRDDVNPGVAAGKISKSDTKIKAKNNEPAAYDYVTEGDPRFFKRNSFAPEMSVLSSVMRFSPETKAGNASMFGFAMAYATALGLAGAALLAGKSSDKKDNTEDRSNNGENLLLQSGEATEPEVDNKKHVVVGIADKAEAFVNMLSKSSLPLAAIGQASLQAGSLFPDNRILATGVAAGLAGVKAVSDAYYKKYSQESQREPDGDGIINTEEVKSERRGKRDKLKQPSLEGGLEEIAGDNNSKKDISKDEDKGLRRGVAVAMGVNAILQLSGSDKHSTPFPVNVAAMIAGTALAVDSLKDFKHKRAPEPDGDKQSLASMKLYSKLATASLVLAQTSSPENEARLMATSIALGVMAASNLPYYGVSKLTDRLSKEAGSFVDKYRNNKNSVGSVDPSNLVGDDESRISPQRIQRDKSRGRGPVEI